MKVGILTYHRAVNYGALLQAYALENVICQLGQECELIDYRNPYIEREYAPVSLKTVRNIRKLRDALLYNGIRRQRMKKFRRFLTEYASRNCKKPVDQVPQKEGCKQISITLDATYGADNTGELLQVLMEYGVKATFFVSGIWAEAYPQKLREIIAAGCEVGNHSDTHTHLRDCPVNYVIEEIENCNKKIEAAAGISPKLMRLPFGEYNYAMLELIEQKGMTAIQWSIDSLDWKVTETPESIYDRILSQVSPGKIILCHNGGIYTPGVLKKVLGTLLEQGYEFVTVSELLRS